MTLPPMGGVPITRKHLFTVHHRLHYVDTAKCLFCAWRHVANAQGGTPRNAILHGVFICCFTMLEIITIVLLSCILSGWH